VVARSSSQSQQPVWPRPDGAGRKSRVSLALRDSWVTSAERCRRRQLARLGRSTASDGKRRGARAVRGREQPERRDRPQPPCAPRPGRASARAQRPRLDAHQRGDCRSSRLREPCDPTVLQHRHRGLTHSSTLVERKNDRTEPQPTRVRDEKTGTGGAARGALPSRHARGVPVG